MPTSVFPTLGFFGSTKSVQGASRFTRVFDNGTYRTYLRSATPVDRVNLKITSVTKTKRDAIDTLFRARMIGTTQATFEFYLYDGDVVSAVDLTGASSTGRRVGIFPDENHAITWSRDGSCRWSASIEILLVG